MIIFAQAGKKVRRRLDVFVIAIPIELELYNWLFSMDLLMQCDLKIYCVPFLFLRNPGLSPPNLNVSSSPESEGVYPGCVFQTSFKLTKAFALVTAIIS